MNNLERNTVKLVDLSDKKILVTGASSGIGRACAVLASQLGAHVVLTARRESVLRETLTGMEHPDDHIIVACDITDPSSVKKIFDISGKLDGLVHAAGIGPMCPIGFVDNEHVESVFQTNYFSFLELMKFCSKARNRNSRFSAVAISSVSAFAGWGGGVVYCGSKGALSSSVRALAMELAPKGIRVNAVCPSNIRTPLYEAGSVDMNDEASLKVLLEKQPLGLGEPEQVSNAVAFLLSDASSFITGVNLPVDGGYLAH